MPYAVGAALALAAADFMVKLASGKISNSLALLCYGGCAFLFGLGWVLWLRCREVPQSMSMPGLLAALAVGVFFSLVTIGLYAAFSRGAPISVASPLIRVGGLLVASMLGVVFLHENITTRYVAGMVLACVGVYLIATKNGG